MYLLDYYFVDVETCRRDNGDKYLCITDLQSVGSNDV